MLPLTDQLGCIEVTLFFISGIHDIFIFIGVLYLGYAT